jgi:hypothetical protein
MENKELFNQIKSAAENEETKDFPAMEKVWQRVEEKLDNKEDKKAMFLWKKIAIAASLLLFATLGYQFFINKPIEIEPNKAITRTDSIKETTSKTNALVTAEPRNPAIKKEAEQLLQKQIKPANQVALEENVEADNDMVNKESISPSQIGYLSVPTVSENSKANDNVKLNYKKTETKEIEVFVDKRGKISNEKKEDPLVVIDSKVEKENLKDLKFNEADSLVVLNEPLYIINGSEYTEQELFGPKPTSPYTPLNKQEIETISILQNEKAIEIYGTKGKKGVVIITTKNGKPLTASKKAK